MDELQEFFNTGTVIKLRGPLTGGVRITKDDTINELNRCEEHRKTVVPSGIDYAEEIKRREMALYLKNEVERQQYGSVTGGLESMEQLSSILDSQDGVNIVSQDNALLEVYDKYSFQRKEDTNNLDINDYKEQILNKIQAFTVNIIEGPTGCGKTTQVPQWILDDSYQKRKPCKIVVTQPRRIAAMSIAKRVAQERGWNLGGLVGYQVGLDNKTSVDTRIHYVTTGVLLQKLVTSKSLSEFTHIILDEVHERGQEMDFLLLVVKKLLYTVSYNVKVVLMSATINKKSFRDYFRIPTPIGPQTTECIEIEKKDPMFTVKTYYLNHLNKFNVVKTQTKAEKFPENVEPGIAPDMISLIIKLLNAFESIDKDEDVYTDRQTADLPSVLIFLPGIHEIEDMYDNLTNTTLRKKVVNEQCAGYGWWVLPLHSTITADEQVRVFARSRPGFRKIILATNIAESSITVPDIKYVVDFCLMKEIVADNETNFTSLKLSWATKTNCEQRAGRAGRVRDGRVYRLVDENFYDNLAEEAEPEIVRCPLERLVLLAKTLDMGPPSDILALAMNPPDLSNIHRTILVLKEIGALKKTSDREWSSCDGDITYLGRIMAKLPVDVRISKLIALGYIFGCLEESVIMAAAMSVKCIFKNPFRDRLNAYNSRLTWADGSTSDCIALLNVYKVWQHMCHGRNLTNAELKDWSSRFYVQRRPLKELDEMVRELKLRLSREGIDAKTIATPWAKHEITLALKIILAGAFYPNYFIQVSQDEGREREAIRTLSGLDPRNSVYLKNFPDHQPGEVYASIIQKAVHQQIGDEPTVSFDNNSKKVYLSFNDGVYLTASERDSGGNPTIPGQVALPIYKSVKARQLRLEIRIPLLPLEKANALAAALQVQKSKSNLESMVPRLPDIDITYIPIKISHVLSTGRFWVQYNDESTFNDIVSIQQSLKNASLLVYTGELAVGEHYASPYVDATGTQLCRVRILKLMPGNMIEIIYIDYGSFGRVNASNLYELPKNVCSSAPPLAMQCVLAELSPSPLLDERGHWSRKAQLFFNDITSRGPLHGKVYSVVHGVVAIELFVNRNAREICSVNQELIKKGFAIPSEESYDSKLNHDLRETANELNLAQKNAYNREQTELAYQHTQGAKYLNTKDCISDISLKGPYSPLETGVHSLMYASRGKMIQIEWNSVNSVLLDTDPQQSYERLMVVGEVGQNMDKTRLTLRYTTMMPNIPALPAIIALLFCPMAELRRDAECSRYVSTLCGLGSDEAGRPYFPEHDLLVNIDADLNIDDIGTINHIRHLMDYMLHCSEGQDMPTTDDQFRPQIPGIIRESIMKLLTSRRRKRDMYNVPSAWEWKSIPEDELLEISVPDMVERAVVFPLHTPIELHPPSDEQLLQLKRENDNLKLLISRTPISSNVEMSCKLCDTGPMPAHALRIHIYSNAHKEKEEDLNRFQT